MKVSPDMTLREARDLFYKAHGVPEDGVFLKINGLQLKKNTERHIWTPYPCQSSFGDKMPVPLLIKFVKYKPYSDLVRFSRGWVRTPLTGVQGDTD